jgi:hypothetical protein
MRKNYAKNTVHLLLSTDRSVDCRLVSERLRNRAVFRCGNRIAMRNGSETGAVFRCGNRIAMRNGSETGAVFRCGLEKTGAVFRFGLLKKTGYVKTRLNGF